MNQIRFPALLLSFLLLVSLFGCGDGTTDPAVTDPGTETPGTKAPETAAPIPPDGNRLFDNPLPGIYNYCPSVIEEADGTRYLYYCTNRESYQITDYVGCRRGTPNADGTYTYGEETIVLSPTAGSWDARHTCDPSVIRGVFRLNGHTYSYLMAYLGCTSNDCQENKVGLAVAEKPDGPFLPVGNTPIVDFTADPNVSVFQWGVGQPSVVSIDCAGKVWLFYTVGDKNGTRTVVRDCDFSDLSAPVLGEEVTVSTVNLKNLNGDADYLNNADFAYDAVKNVFYAASDCHPTPASDPDFISSDYRVGVLRCTPRQGAPFFFSSESARWTPFAEVGEEITGFPRNHNVGLVRDEYGRLPERGWLTVCYTVSIEGPDSLWSYRIYDGNFKLK